MADWIIALGNKIWRCFPRFEKVYPNEAGVFLRLAKCKRTLEEGMYFCFPFIDDVQTLDVKTQVINLPNQSITTKDGKTLAVSGAIEYSIRDAKKALLEVQDFDKSLQNLSMGIIAHYVSQREYVENSNLDGLEKEVIAGIRSKANDWGLNIKKFWITDLAEHKVYRLMTHEAPSAIIVPSENYEE